MNITRTILLLLISLSGICSCKKYLEVKADNKLVVISTLRDLQSLIDSYNQINFRDPGLGEVSADDNYVMDADFGNLNEYDRALYLWNDFNIIPPYSVFSGNSWADSYNTIYRANTILYNIDKIGRNVTNANEYDNIKGQAYLLRGKCFLQVAWLWSLAYDSLTADTDLGIPLRLNPDFNETSKRASLQQTYDQVIYDLKMASALLPKTAAHVIRPSKAAAYAYLARTFLSMRKYTQAGLYADSSLQINDNLLDYNTDINISLPYPFQQFNKEVIYSCRMSFPAPLINGRVDSFVYRSYTEHDLRKELFFQTEPDGSVKFRGGYEGVRTPFTGIATDEMYLTRAECEARTGQIGKALTDINTLLAKRFLNTEFEPITTTDASEVLEIILGERRKELVLRGIRWMDIKRFNKEGANITLIRSLNAKEYVLLPNDQRYALAIPEDIINRSGMQQNYR